MCKYSLLSRCATECPSNNKEGFCLSGDLEHFPGLVIGACFGSLSVFLGIIFADCAAKSGKFGGNSTLLEGTIWLRTRIDLGLASISVQVLAVLLGANYFTSSYIRWE